MTQFSSRVWHLQRVNSEQIVSSSCHVLSRQLDRLRRSAPPPQPRNKLQHELGWWQLVLEQALGRFSPQLVMWSRGDVLPYPGYDPSKVIIIIIIIIIIRQGH